MSPIQETSAQRPSNSVAGFARTLGGSRGGQLFVAALTAACYGGLAYVVWHARDLAALYLVFYFVITGLRYAGRLLPIRAATRARWEREKRLLQDHPAGVFRIFLWLGGIVFISQFLTPEGRPMWPKPGDLLVPSIFILAGTVCTIIARRIVRDAEKAGA